jgi:hypothetical protein
VHRQLFQPSGTHAPPAKALGFGLSTSHDIIVKQHGGSIEVDAQVGEFTEVQDHSVRAAVFVLKSAKGRILSARISATLTVSSDCHLAMISTGYNSKACSHQGRCKAKLLRRMSTTSPRCA